MEIKKLIEGLQILVSQGADQVIPGFERIEVSKVTGRLDVGESASARLVALDWWKDNVGDWYFGE